MMKKQTDMRYIVDAKDHFGEVKMWYDSKKKHQVGIVVEAKADELLFRKLFLPHPHIIFFCSQGWTKVASVLVKAKKHNMGSLIGIIDADFKRVLNFTLPDNVFLTDFHDIEIMMTQSDAWDNVINQFCDNKKLQQFESKQGISLFEFITRLAKPISILRYLKEKHGYKFVFRVQRKGKYLYLKYHNFIDNKTLSINIPKLFSTLENKSSLPDFFKQNPTIITDFNTLLIDTSIDWREWTNGHDFMNILSIALEKVIGNKTGALKVFGESLEQSFSISYRLSEFKHTQLYLSLQNWETQNFPLKILAS